MSPKQQRSPLDRSMPLRMAGQSLDDEILDFTYDNLLAPLLIAVFLVIMAGLEWWRYYADIKPSPLIYTVGALLGVAFAGFKLWRGKDKLRRLKQGRDGERAVAQYLEWFRSVNAFVFHDIPNGDANIDHLIVSNKGVFTIETKTLSKPLRGACKLQIVSGDVLANGVVLQRNPVVQAKAQAGWLRGWLKESQFNAHVWPVVLFPGWFVEPFDPKSLGAWVLEPKALSKFVENEPERLTREEVKAIASAVKSHIRSLQTQ